MFTDIVARLEALENTLLDETAPARDVDALVRVELAEHLAQAKRIAAALAADESEETK